MQADYQEYSHQLHQEKARWGSGTEIRPHGFIPFSLAHPSNLYQHLRLHHQAGRQHQSNYVQRVALAGHGVHIRSIPRVHG